MRDVQLSPTGLRTHSQVLTDIGTVLARAHKETVSLDERALLEKFSLVRLFGLMMANRHIDGVEGDIVAATALLAGESHVNHNRVWVPWGALTRALSTVPGPKGGYLVGVDTTSPIDTLRPWSVVNSAGASTLNNLKNNVAIPRDTAAPSITWIGHNNPGPSESPPSLGEASLDMRTGLSLTQFSLQLLQQGAGVEPYLQRRLTRAAGEGLDVACLAGPGGLSPLGLLNTAGIGTQSGTSLAHAGLLAMRKAVLLAGGRADALAWVGTPAVQELLGARVRETGATGGGRFLWDDNGILGEPAFVTKNAPASALIVGDWSQMVIGLYGPGVRIEIDPSQNFNAAGLVARVLIMCDVVFPQPAAFAVATSVT